MTETNERDRAEIELAQSKIAECESARQEALLLIERQRRASRNAAEAEDKLALLDSALIEWRAYADSVSRRLKE